MNDFDHRKQVYGPGFVHYLKQKKKCEPVSDFQKVRKNL